MSCKQIIALLLFFAILSSSFVSMASAAVSSVGVSVDVVDFADWLYIHGSQTVNTVHSLFDSDTCGGSGDVLNSRHNFVEQYTQVDGNVGLYYVCENCGKSAGEVMNGTTSEDGTTTPGAYQEYVSTLPINGYSSTGEFYWYPTTDDFYSAIFSFPYSLLSSWGSSVSVGPPVSFPVTHDSFDFIIRDCGTYFSVSSSLESSVFTKVGCSNLSLIAPLSATYYRSATTAVSAYSYASSATSRSFSLDFSEGMSHVSEGSLLSSAVSEPTRVTYPIGSFSADFYLPVYRVVLDTPLEDVSTVYNSTTRMGNIGGTYCKVNNDNSVTEYTTQYIVNEGDNTYTNPATGITQPILDWTYNYDDRTYNLTFVNGDKAVVTYGNENVTVQEISGEDGTTEDYTWHYGGSSRGGGAGRPSPSPSPSPSGNPGVVVPSSGSRVFQHYSAQITQAYGHEGHGGTDCIPSSGVADTVIAHSDGEVVWVQTGQDNNQGSTGNVSYGNAVKIRHANGYYTLYAHLATVEVAQGDHVSKGQALGVMGNTGNSYGAHLHFEVRDDTDIRINSDPYINADLPGLSTGGDLSWWSESMGRLGAILGAPFVAELFSTVGGVFGQMWGWLPPEIAAVFTVGVTFLVIAAVMKFFL